MYVYTCRYDRRRNFSFKHVGFALLTLFEVLTLEGWLDVRDMFGSIDHETNINWLALVSVSSFSTTECV